MKTRWFQELAVAFRFISGGCGGSAIGPPKQKASVDITSRNQTTMKLKSSSIFKAWHWLGSGILIGSLLHGRTSLKEAYADDFLIGTILAGGIEGKEFNSADPQETGLIGHEFNALTAENSMKPQYLQPEEGVFFFRASDEYVEFAETRGMILIGHTLVWHSMTPDWFFKDACGEAVERERALERMKAHIHTVVGRYAGRISYWDVVNEAVEHQGEGKPAALRVSPWLKAIGEDYLEMAFRYAHEADPDAKLYYNDYNMTKKEKVDFVVEMVETMRAKGVPIHGVGLQGHWRLDWPSLAEIEYSLRSFAEAGISVSITEMDISVLPEVPFHQGGDVDDEVAYAEAYDPYSESIPDAVLKQQAERYREVFKLFLKYKANIERISFWGTTDGSSWRNNYPMKDRTDYPLLFDRSFNPKPAYHTLIALSHEN